MIERYLAETISKRIRCSVFKSVVNLEVAIHSYLAEHNGRPKPFAWTAKPSGIPDKVRRGKQTLASEH
jgi:hypothetical protein